MLAYSMKMWVNKFFMSFCPEHNRVIYNHLNNDSKLLKITQDKFILTFKGSRHTLLSAGDVETGWRDGIIGSALQALLFINLLK